MPAPASPQSTAPTSEWPMRPSPGLLFRITFVDSADPGQDFPQLVIRLDDGAERRHGHAAGAAQMLEAGLLHIHCAQGNESEQSVVVQPKEPDIAREGRTHPPAARTAMTAAATVAHEQLVSLIDYILLTGVVGILEAALRS